jgi:uncharacterized protein YegL
MSSLPGGPVEGRPMQFIWIADCSGSMHGQKIHSLNDSIKQSIPIMRSEADQNTNAEIFVRAIRFSSGASWHVAHPTPIRQFEWNDLTADGVTDMGRAMRMVADQLNTAQMPERGLPPVLVLVSDGQPTDDFEGGLKELMSKPWAKKAVRVSIAIGEDADREVLQKFIGHNEMKPLPANSPEQLAKQIRWVTTTLVKAASAPASRPPGSSATSNVNVPTAPADDPADAMVTW